LASPITVKPEEIAHTAPGYSPRERSWNYLEPWTGGEWRIGDILTDQQIAWESCLFQAAARREDLLRNFHRIHKNALAAREPYAFVIPAIQRDPAVLRHVLETLRFGLVEVEQASAPFSAQGREYGAGAYVVRLQQPYGAWAKTLLERQQYPDLRLYPGGPPRRPYDVTAHTLPLLFGVDVHTVARPFEAKLAPPMHFTGLPPLAGSMKLPRGRRVGLYRSHIPSMDEGWTRWMFEFLGIEYQSVDNAAILAGELASRWDVIVFPDQGPAAIHYGYKPGTMPPEYAGGLGDAGAAALKAFAEAGGKLVFLNGSTAFASGHVGVPARNALRGLANRDHYVPGSLLHVTLDTSHPLANGLPASIAVWNEHSPAWDVAEGGPVKAVARYPASGVLASGWLLGEQHLGGKAALIDVPMGKGRAILFGMRPQYRGQSFLTMRLLYNALLPY
jgi:hypothetical protein